MYVHTPYIYHIYTRHIHIQHTHTLIYRDPNKQTRKMKSGGKGKIIQELKKTNQPKISTRNILREIRNKSKKE